MGLEAAIIQRPARWCRRSSMWVELSNSGDTLEPQVPSHPLKWTGGWSNYSCMVTSLRASERNVGYRGSKSAISKNIAVKEQRVDGSCILIPSYTQGNFNVEVYSNGLWKKLSDQNPFLGNTRFLRYCSNLSTTINLSPYAVTGLVDAEGCFRISILKSPRYKLDKDNLPFIVRLYFQLSLHKKDSLLLESLKDSRPRPRAVDGPSA